MQAMGYLLCFNPRARAGRDAERKAIEAALPVSIHAPARGATRRLGEGMHNSQVSIHAPARGATAEYVFMIVSPIRFNPRARAGRDLAGAYKTAQEAKFQSTRPRGARPPCTNCSSEKRFHAY